MPSSKAKSKRYLFTSRTVLTSLLCLVVLGSASAQQEATVLEELIVNPDGEPTTQNPAGIGASGATLGKAPGSAGDPLRGLQALPGLHFVDDESAEPAVRGSRPGDNLFLVDHMPGGYVFHSDGSLSAINADLIEKFEIYPAAHGPEYFGVTGGVFDITLRDPRTDRFGVSLDANFLQAGLLMEGPISQSTSFYFAARRSYIDLLVADQIEEEQDDEGITLIEFPNYDDYQGKFVWSISPETTMHANITGASDHLEIRVEDTSELAEQEPILVGRIAENIRFDSQGVSIDQDVGDGRSWRAALQHVKRSDNSALGNAGGVDVSVDSFRLKTRVVAPINGSHELTLGALLEATEAQINADINVPACTEFEADCRLTGSERFELTETVKVNAAQLYLKDTWFVNEKFSFLPGVSVFHEDYTGKTFVEPRVSAEYYLTDDTTLTAAAGIYHQSPGFDEINDTFGNPNLKYIESHQIALGVEKALTAGWSVKTESYYKTLNKLVTRDDELRYNNNGEGEAYGIDTLIRKELTDKWSGWLSLSLSKAEREQAVTGNRFPFEYDQPVNANFVISYKPSNKWQFSGKLWAHSGAVTTPVISAAEDPSNPGSYIPEYGDINSERFPTFKRLDIRVDRNFKTREGRSLSAYFELLNATNAKNALEYDYNNDYTERTAEYQLPRIVSLGVKATF